MKSKPKPSDEYTAFQSLLRRVVTADHEEVKAQLAAERAAKKRKPKASASGRASGDKG